MTEKYMENEMKRQGRVRAEKELRRSEEAERTLPEKKKRSEVAKRPSAEKKARSARPRRSSSQKGAVNREHEELIQWFQTVKFRKVLFGGVDEIQMWKKLEELNKLYEAAIRAERARYDALLLERTGAGEGTKSRNGVQQ